MVRPGLVNLDFADVETVMKGMGKAMMGTGEAEGDKRAEEATNAALNNPLIDEYSLKGAKGLLVNITGGSDLTTFEVDEAVNRIRAEVDPEADLIFGSIEDENLNGKIRVSIVATSLDGQEPQVKPVISMVGRINNRVNNYPSNSSSVFKPTNTQTIMATEGATALNIDNVTSNESTVEEQKIIDSDDKHMNDLSMENANYLQNLEINQDGENSQELTNFEVDSIEMATPQLFSNEDLNDNEQQTSTEKNSPEMFDNQISQEVAEQKEPEMFDNSESEEDFEIPAFLRKQKD